MFDSKSNYERLTELEEAVNQRIANDQRLANASDEERSKIIGEHCLWLLKEMGLIDN